MIMERFATGVEYSRYLTAMGHIDSNEAIHRFQPKIYRPISTDYWGSTNCRTFFLPIKALIANVGFSLERRSKTIFPAMYINLAIGVLTARYLIWMSQLTAAIVVAAAIAIIIERPLLSFPIQFAPFILICAYLAQYMARLRN